MRRFGTFLALTTVLACAPAMVSKAAPVTPAPQSGEFLALDAPTGTGVPEMDEAVSAYRQRDFERCLKLLQEANEKHPETPPARLVLAKLFLKDNLLPQGRITLERACIDAPDNPEIYLIFGQLSLLEKRISDADLNFVKASALIEAGNFSEEQKQNLLRDSLIGMATVQESRNDWKAAEESLRRLIEILPNASAPRQRLAAALFFLDRPDEAFGQLEMATKLDPQMAPPAIGMAWLFTQKRNLEQAEQWMRKGVEQNPDNANAHANFAQWLLQQDRAKEAEQYIKNAVSKDSQAVSFLRLRGEIARQLKDFEEAERVFSDLTAKFPGDVNYSNLLALSLIEQIDLAKHRRARDYAENNFRQYKNQPEILTTLGRVYYRMGEMDKAEAALRNAFSTGRATSETAYYMGLVAADRGRVEEAKDMYRRAIETPGPFLFRDEASERLKRLEGPATGAAGNPSP